MYQIDFLLKTDKVTTNKSRPIIIQKLNHIKLSTIQNDYGL